MKKKKKASPADLFTELRTRGTSVVEQLLGPGSLTSSGTFLCSTSVPRAVRHCALLSTFVSRTRFISAVPGCFIVSCPVIWVTRWSPSARTGSGFGSRSRSTRLLRPPRLPGAAGWLQSPVTLSVKSSFLISPGQFWSMAEGKHIAVC